MAESMEELELLIDDYLDGRMNQSQRQQFEARMKQDSNLRSKVMSATHSVELVQQALGWVTPGEEFDDQVESKIIEITQSGRNLKPIIPAKDHSLTSRDPDAKLLGDPEAAREKQRLITLAIVAATLFGLATLAILYCISV
ncbi:MAG: hypothetical protein V1899_00990 [Planctomycetota bacterium]